MVGVGAAIVDHGNGSLGTDHMGPDIFMLMLDTIKASGCLGADQTTKQMDQLGSATGRHHVITDLGQLTKG